MRRVLGLVLFRRDAPLFFANAELKDPVKDKLRRFGLYDRFGDARFFPTIGAAIYPDDLLPMRLRRCD